MRPSWWPRGKLLPAQQAKAPSPGSQPLLPSPAPLLFLPQTPKKGQDGAAKVAIPCKAAAGQDAPERTTGQGLGPWGWGRAKRGQVAVPGGQRQVASPWGRASPFPMPQEPSPPLDPGQLAGDEGNETPVAGRAKLTHGASGKMQDQHLGKRVFSSENNQRARIRRLGRAEEEIFQNRLDTRLSGMTEAEPNPPGGGLGAGGGPSHLRQGPSPGLPGRRGWERNGLNVLKSTTKIPPPLSSTAGRPGGCSSWSPRL